MSPTLLVKLCSCRFKFIPLFPLSCVFLGISTEFTYTTGNESKEQEQRDLAEGRSPKAPAGWECLQGLELLLLPPVLPTQPRQEEKRNPEQNLALHKSCAAPCVPREPPGASLCPSSKGAALAEQRMNKFNSINNQFNSINSILPVLPAPPCSSTLPWPGAAPAGRAGMGMGSRGRWQHCWPRVWGHCTVTLCTVTSSSAPTLSWGLLISSWQLWLLCSGGFSVCGVEEWLKPCFVHSAVRTPGAAAVPKGFRKM